MPYSTQIVNVLYKSVQTKFGSTVKTLTNVAYNYNNNLHIFSPEKGEPLKIQHSDIGELFINNVQIVNLSNPFTVAGLISDYYLNS